MLPIYLMTMEYESRDDRSKISFLYETYKNLMYSVAFKILKDTHLAEDAVQEAFLSIIKLLHKFDDLESDDTKNYLIITVRNAAYRIYNKRKNMILVDGFENYVSEKNQENVVLSKEKYIRILDLIKLLDDRYADVLLLRFYYGFDIKEIALSLNISEGNVRILLHRAKKKLKEYIDKEEQADDR